MVGDVSVPNLNVSHSASYFRSFVFSSAFDGEAESRRELGVVVGFLMHAAGIWKRPAAAPTYRISIRT